MKIACVTYSYVAEPLGYPEQMTWSQVGEAAIRLPILDNVESYLNRLAPAKLDGLELWYNHAWPATITPALAGEVRKRLAAQGMVCCAMAGSPGNPAQDPYQSEARFQTALLLRAGVIAGDVKPDVVAELDRLAARYGVRVGYENHPEKESAEILDVIRGGTEWIGVAFDTGSLAQHDGDPVAAVHELGLERIVHVHLRDVPAVGSDASVALGTGIVDFPGVLAALQAIGYDGWLSIEIPTETHDPTGDIIASAQLVRRIWEQQ